VPVVMRCIARKQDTLATGKPALAQHDAFQKINGPVGDWNSLRRRFDTLIIIAGQRRTARLRGGSLDRCSSLRRKVPRPRPLSDRDPTLRKNVVMFPASSADSVGAINRFPSSSPPAGGHGAARLPSGASPLRSRHLAAGVRADLVLLSSAVADFRWAPRLGEWLQWEV
jgi:hypothetical protein